MTTPSTPSTPMELLSAARTTDQLGELKETVTGKISRHSYDIADLTLEDGREARMVATEFYPNRRWEKNASYIMAVVDDTTKPVRVTTNHPDLVRLLAEGQVPELRDGTVRIMRIARRPGIRTKMSVAPTREGEDAVGHMLGRAANRIRAVSRQLGGERIDVVAYSDDPATHAVNALAVRALAVETGENGNLRITIPPYQAEAAAGGGNINLHLAAQLVGRRIELVVA